MRQTAQSISINWQELRIRSTPPLIVRDGDCAVGCMMLGFRLCNIAWELRPEAPCPSPEHKQQPGSQVSPQGAFGLTLKDGNSDDHHSDSRLKET